MRTLSVLLQDPGLQLVVLVVLIHLADAARLLYADEGLLLHTGLGWRAVTGSDQWRLGGRRLVFPLALRPAVMVRMDSGAGAGTAAEAHAGRRCADRLADDLAARAGTLRWLLPGGYGVAALLFVALPVIWAARLGDGLLALALGLVYLTALMTALGLVAGRRALGLTLAEALGHGLDGLLCPPRLVTLPARLAARWPVGGDFLALAAALLPADRWAAVRERAERQRA